MGILEDLMPGAYGLPNAQPQTPDLRELIWAAAKKMPPSVVGADLVKGAPAEASPSTVTVTPRPTFGLSYGPSEAAPTAAPTAAPSMPASSVPDLFASRAPPTASTPAPAAPPAPTPAAPRPVPSELRPLQEKFANPTRSFGDTLADTVAGFAGGASPMASIAGAINGYRGGEDQRLAQTANYKFFLDKTGDANLAMAAMVNPDVAKHVMGQIYGDKFTKLAPGETLIENKTRQPVFTNTENKPTTEQSNYATYVAQSRAAGQMPRSFNEWDLERKRAGAMTMSLDQNSFDKEMGKLQAERMHEYIKRGGTASEMVGDLKTLRDLSSKITPGKSAEIQLALGPWAEALGVKIDGLDNLQAYNAVIDKMAPRMRVPGSGATSDFDAKQFLRSLPGLSNTAGGNEIIQNTFEALQRRDIAAAEIASRAAAKEITATEAEKLIRDLPDPYDLWKKNKGSAPTETKAAAPAATRHRVWTPEGLR